MHQKNTTKTSYLDKVKGYLDKVKGKLAQRQAQRLKNKYIQQKKQLHNLNNLAKYEDELKKLTKLRNKYVQHLVKHNLVPEEKKEDIIPRDLHHLEMKTFDEDVARNLAKCRLANKEQHGVKNKLKFGRKKKRTEQDVVSDNKPLAPSQFGYAKQQMYFYYLELMNLVTQICRKNKWLTRKDWVEHGVPLNRLTLEFIKASKEYSEIKMYYAKLKFDKQTNQYKGKV